MYVCGCIPAVVYNKLKLDLLQVWWSVLLASELAHQLQESFKNNIEP